MSRGSARASEEVAMANVVVVEPTGSRVSRIAAPSPWSEVGSGPCQTLVSRVHGLKLPARWLGRTRAQ